MRAGRISGEDKRQGSARCSRCRCSRCRSAGAIAVRVQESLIFAAANWVELVWWCARNGGEFFTMWRILDGRGAVALPIARGGAFRDVRRIRWGRMPGVVLACCVSSIR
jgi:hypothetical protein